MLPQHGLRLDDEQRVLPMLYRAGEEDEEATLDGREAWTFDRTVEDDELLTQQEVFRDQLRFTANEVSAGTQRRAVRDRLSQVRDGGGESLEPAFDERLNALQDPEHLCPPPCCSA